MALSSILPSLMVEINGGVVKVTEISPDSVKGDVYLPLKSTDAASPGSWQIAILSHPRGQPPPQ